MNLCYFLNIIMEVNFKGLYVPNCRVRMNMLNLKIDCILHLVNIHLLASTDLLNNKCII
jgi:hypothetical protein